MNRRQYERELKRLIPEVAEAAIEAFRQISRPASRRAVEAAIASQSADEVIRLLGLDEGNEKSAFAILVESLHNPFVLAGAAQALFLQRQARGVVITPIRFDADHDGAVEHIRRQAAELATGLSETARNRVRDALADGVRENLTPRQIATRLLGVTGPRVDRAGTLPLTDRQAANLASLRTLLGDGTTPPDSDYFRREGRDRRFDGAIRRAIREGRPVADAFRAAAAEGYMKRMLEQRALVIARTEVVSAINAGRYEAILQAVGRGVPGIMLNWWSQRDIRVRDLHVAMHGQIRPPDAPFNSPNGDLLRFPGDASLGAQAVSLVNCRCYLGVSVRR